MNAASFDAVATVELPASPERVFSALTSSEITQWWVRPGVFDTREWSGDVRAGGKWRISGIARGNPYAIEGEYVEIDAPKKLVHTWQLVGKPFVTTVSYELEPTERGTRLTLHHDGSSTQEMCDANRIGWETSFEALQRLLEQ